MYSEAITKISPWEKLNIARNKERPNARFYIENLFEDFTEFHGDRCFQDDKAIICGIASIEGINVTIIGINKGKSTSENLEVNFGMPHPEGYRKALRHMKQAEKFNRPIICFVDTPGAFCGIGAEERGQGHAIAQNLMIMSRLKTPIISIVIGEGGSGGALALAVADKVYMLENAVYSILSPEGFASILWKDGSRAREACEIMKITSEDLKEFNIIDTIIKEPQGGAHINPQLVINNMKDEIMNDLLDLREVDLDELIEERYKKFRQIGSF